MSYKQRGFSQQIKIKLQVNKIYFLKYPNHKWRRQKIGANVHIRLWVKKKRYCPYLIKSGQKEAKNVQNFDRKKRKLKKEFSNYSKYSNSSTSGGL